MRTIANASTLLLRGDVRGINERIKRRLPKRPVDPAVLLNTEMKKHIKPRTEVVAFFYPDGAFRSLFGDVTKKLEAEKNLTVLNLYGTTMSDSLESRPNSFYVGGGLIESVAVVDLFFVATIMDVLPKRGKRALLNHGSFAAFCVEEDISRPNVASDENVAGPEVSFEELYRETQVRATHFNAFFPLFDYYLMASPHFKQYAMQLAKNFGMQLLQEGGPSDAEIYEAMSSRCAPETIRILIEGLKRGSQKLPREINILPTGYPQIDTGYRKGLAASNVEKKYITFAPTPINGKPAWLKYSALKNSGEAILEALLEGFPEYEIVFKPHISDKNPETEKLTSRFENHPRFRTDWSGSSHGDLYSKTAMLVSDFSQTAFTFASSYQRPVLFYSHAEDQIPMSVRTAEYCAGRELVGVIATTPKELIEKGRDLLANASMYQDKIQKFTNSHLYNIGRSEDYICEAIPKMLAGERASEWTAFKNISI